MNLPTATDYLEAIQAPCEAFGDARLQRAHPECGPMGLPLSWSGAYATIFQLRDAQGRSHAIRCFTNPVADLNARYQAYQAFLPRTSPALRRFLLPAELIPKGIRLPRMGHQAPFHPIIRMDWAQGRTLDAWVADHLAAPDQLRWLSRQLGELAAALESQGFVHGDLQHRNILITEGGPVLVDYDNLVIPGGAVLPRTTEGIPAFRHPLSQAQTALGAQDRFALLVMHVALEALIRQPSLHQRWGQVEGLLFTGPDFRHPGTSPLFQALRRHADLRPLADRLALVCGQPAEATPWPREAFHGVPRPSISPSGSTARFCLPPFTLEQVVRLGGLYAGSGGAVTSRCAAAGSPLPGLQEGQTQPRRSRAWLVAWSLLMAGPLWWVRAHPTVRVGGYRSEITEIRSELAGLLAQRKDHLVSMIVRMDEEQENLRNLPDGLQLARLDPATGEAKGESVEAYRHGLAQIREEARKDLIQCDTLLESFDATARDPSLSPVQAVSRLVDLPGLPGPVRARLLEAKRTWRAR